MMHDQLILQMKESILNIDKILEKFPKEYALNFKIDFADYLTNILFIFNALNEENLDLIEELQEGKFYNLNNLKDEDEFSESVPYFINGAIEYCEILGEEMLEDSNLRFIDYFNTFYDYFVLFYERMGSVLLTNILDKRDFKLLLYYYKYIRNAENCWNEYIDKFDLAPKKYINFSLKVNDISLDEFLETNLNL